MKSLWAFWEIISAFLSESQPNYFSEKPWKLRNMRILINSYQNINNVSEHNVIVSQHVAYIRPDILGNIWNICYNILDKLMVSEKGDKSEVWCVDGF